VRRERLRPAYGPGELVALYAAPYDHRRWVDHIHRVNATIAAGLTLLDGELAGTAADLSCGDGTILRALPAQRRIFGDLVSSCDLDLVGPIEATIGEIDPVDLLVCTETLEHLDDPDGVLQAIAEKARMLLLSTPVEAWGDDNPEHYWAWDAEEVEDLLTAAGFTVVDYRPLPLWYRFGIWGCVR